MYWPTLQGKLHETLEEHLGQLAAEIRSAREQYTRVFLSKHKLEDEGEFKEVGPIELWRLVLRCAGVKVI